MKRYNVHLDEETIKRLRWLRDNTGVPVAVMIRMAVAKFLREKEGKLAKVH